jgi:hypothetical protein
MAANEATLNTDATQAPAAGETTEETVPQRPPLSDEHKQAITEALGTSGAAAVFEEVASYSNDLAMEHLTTQNRKGVLFAMKLGAVAQAGAKAISKAEERMNKKRGKGGDDENDDDDDDTAVE